MPSLRPSQMTLQSRTDGGPFIDFLLYDDEGAPTDDAQEAKSCDVFFSDITPELESPDALKTWHRILSVTPEDICIFPIHQRGSRVDYGAAKHAPIEQILVARPKAHPYSVPTNRDELEGLLSSLPNGFAKDWQVGLGLLWEYRFVIESIADIGGIDTIVIHGEGGSDDAKIVGGSYYLGIDRYSELKRSIDRLSQRHQRETRTDKQLVCYTGLAHAADPTRNPERPKKLPVNVLTDLINLGRGRSQLSRADQQSAVKLVKDNAEIIIKQAPKMLLELKADIERVTLSELIERYKKLMSADATEGKWQKFLADNPFILDMAFPYPVKVVCERPYVGSMCFSGSGANYSDFLMVAKSTGNVALIEIKHPQQDLLKTPKYRNNTYAPSFELSGTVAQIINQRASVQRSINDLSDNLEEPVHAHAIQAIVIIGRTPTDKHLRRAFEQYRNSLKDVSVVTFDELQQRLEDIHKALSPATPLSSNLGFGACTEDDNIPF
ncbi:Shedu immune nuclease family protein [Halopseudomonas bauzanensis]|uniref:DUF4263 domain-containing protein n=1 Tax=Halopseudomonas bauzanensis TaxID=653930 RepID=A0A4U0YPQ8_9GAMM|nr:Shedu immune nuclease family protein [Halopseudomonas bauzanensis]TKA91601.1 DUF4263 domain-containing protein [Halopseudomonas bauzanensis]